MLSMDTIPQFEGNSSTNDTIDLTVLTVDMNRYHGLAALPLVLCLATRWHHGAGLIVVEAAAGDTFLGKGM